MILKLDIADLLNDTPGEIKEHINRLNKCRLSDIKFLDLLVAPDNKNGMRHGVYLFFNEENKCVYVGKCSSLHFAERLAQHFRMSPNNNPNGFLGKTVKKLCKKETDTYREYVNTANDERLANHRYLMIAVNPDMKKENLYTDGETKPKLVGTLEKFFIKLFDPEYNERDKNFNLSKDPKKTLREILLAQPYIKTVA